ncbi:MAG: cation transporter, partial [bacterium]
MNSADNLKRYRIRGLDCASCANEIETALRKLEGFDRASVSFSTNTIMIPEDRREIAEETISKIEPHARIVERIDAGRGEAVSTGIPAVVL